jgi:hypothetical protein
MQQLEIISKQEEIYPNIKMFWLDRFGFGSENEK